MNPLDKQIEVLNRLVEIMKQSAGSGYERLSCRFEIDIEDESVSQDLSSVKDAQVVSSFLDDPDWEVMNLVVDLYNQMKAHTNGEWTAFNLTVGTDGKAKTSFEYPK